MLARSVVFRPGSVQLIDARGEKFVQSDSRVCMSCRIDAADHDAAVHAVAVLQIPAELVERIAAVRD